MGRALAAAVMVCMTACLQPQLVPCGDLLCPAGTTCVEATLCATAEQLDACIDKRDGDSCGARGIVGRCELGACVAAGCGNLTVDVGEECDDGNQAGGDGCAADCRKVEVCGDGFRDESDQCDDGNQNPADGCDECVTTRWTATATIGGANTSSGGLNAPGAVAIDRGGNLYIADTENHRVRKVDAFGVVTTMAGDGTLGSGGDGAPAASAQLAFPAGVAVDGLGNLDIADTSNARIRKVDTDGIITTIAGTGQDGFAGDLGPATAAQLRYPSAVTVDGLGNLYIADAGNHRIRKVDAAGTITTVAGDGTAGFRGDGGPAITAWLANPDGVAVDGAGALYIVDANNARIRKVDAAGAITTIAGNGTLGYSGDAGAATSAKIDSHGGIAVDGYGNVFIADGGNHRVRRIDTAGVITTVVGEGTRGYSGDGGPATSARLALPRGLVLDDAHNLYVADTDNRRIRKVDTAGTIATIAGDGTSGGDGDGGAAISAPLNSQGGIALDGLGNLYIADTFNHRVRRVDRDGMITTVAGDGSPGFGGDGAAATAAQLTQPWGVAIDGAGNMYIADAGNNRIRKVDAAGIISTFAGIGGTVAYGGDGGPATSAPLGAPWHVAIDGAGNVLIADTYNCRIRKVSPAGVISTIAGDGTCGYAGDGGQAAAARLANPAGVAVDGAGNLFIADTYNHRVRKVSPAGVISTIAGDGTFGYAGDGTSATSARFASPGAIAVDGAGTIYVADTFNHRVRKIDTAGIITTVAGDGVPRASGDGGRANIAGLAYPRGIAAPSLTDLYIGDQGNKRVRWIDSAGTITTVAGLVSPAGAGPFAPGSLADPRALAVGPPSALAGAPPSLLVAGGRTGTLQAAHLDRGWLETVAGRYPHEAATANLARYRSSSFGEVGGVAYDPGTRRVYLTEPSNHRLHVVTLVDPQDARTWTMAPLANMAGIAGFADGAPATARFRSPRGLFFDTTRHVLYIADTGNHVVRELDPTAGSVTSVAGRPAVRGNVGDGGAAIAALLFAPEAVTRCSNGDMFIADTGNHRIRRVDAATGLMSTVLGDGVPASSGEGGPARNFPVDAPRALACDPFGNLYVTSTTSVRMLPAADSHVVDGTGNVQTIYGRAPATSFPASATRCLTGLAVVDATTLQVADSCTGLLVRLQLAPAPM